LLCLGRVRLLTIVWLGLAACSPAPPPQPAMQLSISVDADANDAVELVAGAQGGFHVWLRYALSGDLPAETVTLQRRAERVADQQAVLHLDTLVSLPAQASDTIPMFMCPTPIGLSIIDERLALSLAVVDAAGVELARAALEVVPGCPAGQLDFCRRICSG